MTDAIFPPARLTKLAIPKPSAGAKAVLVFAMALLMAIPACFVFALVADRQHRAQSVITDVSNLQGGPQQVLGPLLVAPYTAPPPAPPPGQPAGEAVSGWYVVSPEQGQTRIAIKSASLHRSIFDVPVYEAQADTIARFGPLPTQPDLPAGATIDWRQARIVMGFTDLRGAKSDVSGVFTSAAGRSALAFSPASGISLGSGQGSGSFGLVSAPATAVVASPNGGVFQTSLKFTGAQRLSVLPFAKSTSVQVSGDWPSPSFDGGFLPETRRTAGDAFTATWHVPFIARGLSDHGVSTALSLDQLSAKDLGVTFVPANNPYISVIRALKYAVMFVGLVFLTFFVFETLSGKQLHPAQYLLIGLAQMVFYLLLLSVSEYIGFDWGFAIAAAATVALIGLYAGAAFRSRRYQIQALAVFSVVYGLIYLLMRLEDFALLAGSVASFIGLASAMYLTRNIEWYGGKAEPAAPAGAVPAP